MRGVILAGGTGSRLIPVNPTGINKHCLTVYDRPMIYWALDVLHDNGINDITVVSSPKGVGELAIMLKGGISYRVQDRPGGIAQALYCAKSKSRESIFVILGDNIFLPSPGTVELNLDELASCYLTKIPKSRLREFWVPQFNESDKIVCIQEKPLEPSSEYAVTGLYAFEPDVFSRIEGMPVGVRGEMEISDLLSTYAIENKLGHCIFDGFWGDAGTPQGLSDCSLACEKWVNK